MKNEKYIVRIIQAHEWKEFKNIRIKALKEEPEAFVVSVEEARKISEEEWKQRLSGGRIFGIFREDKLLGIAGYYSQQRKKISHIANIYGVYLSSFVRGKGLGRKLMETLISHIINKNIYRKIRLGVSETQTSAMKLYEKLGFKTIGIYKNEIFFDNRYINEVLMELEIENND